MNPDFFIFLNFYDNGSSLAVNVHLQVLLMRLKIGQLPLGLADSPYMAHARPFSFSVNRTLTGCYSQISVNPISVSKISVYSFKLSDTPNSILLLGYFIKPNTPKET